MLGESASPQADSGRKSKRRMVPSRPPNVSNRVRQSPIVKPQGGRRKHTLSSVIPPKEISDLLEQVQGSKGTFQQVSSAALPTPHSGASSESTSISPEPLFENIMGPPPKPISAVQSPLIIAHGSQTVVLNGPGTCPATPASLMRLQQPQSQHASTAQGQSLLSQGNGEPLLEDLSLPEAASSVVRSCFPRIESTIQDDQTTPRLPARKTPKLDPLSMPASEEPVSAIASPALGAMASYVSTPKGSNGSKVEPRPGRGSKKRGNTSSSFISPAIRPKISPSIKPLLPEGGMYLSLCVTGYQRQTIMSFLLIHHNTMLRPRPD